LEKNLKYFGLAINFKLLRLVGCPTDILLSVVIKYVPLAFLRR